MKALALFLIGLNPLLWASFYLISKRALAGADPVAFATLEMSMAALPAGLMLLVFWRHITRRAIQSGLILGGVLFCAVLASTIALSFTTATNTAFFPALNGAIAAIIAALFLRQSLSRGVMIACGLSAAGALLVIFGSVQGGGNPMGDLIAFVAAILYTLYIFAVDRQAAHALHKGQIWVITGVQMLFMAALGWGIFLWQGGTPHLFLDNPNLLKAGFYVGLFTTFFPAIIALAFQKYVPPLTVALLYVPEPVWVAIGARLLDGEAVTALGYVGGGLILLGALVNILGQKAKA